MNLFDLVARLSLDSSDYEAGLQFAQQGLGTFKKVTLATFAASSAAFIAFAKDAVATGMGFDAAMSQVAATMGVSVDEIENLREFAKNMGATTKFTATEAAQALNYMALAGYDAEKSMSMLPTVLNLASAGGFDLARASDMVTDAQSALGLTTEQTTVMVDQMARTASKSNTSVEQLGDAMLTIGGTAKFMAGGTDRLQTVLGLLADNGIKGSEAGTHLRNMLLKLSAPTKDGSDAMLSLGFSVFDAEGKMKDMQEIITDLNKSFEGLTDQQKIEYISKIFNARDVAAVNALLGTSKERWDELGGAIAAASGSAQEMATTQLGNLTGDVTIMKSAVEGLKIQFAEGVTPAIRDIVKRLTKALSNPKTAKFLKDVGRQLGDLITRVTRIVSQKVLPFLINLFDDGGKKLKTFVAVVGGLATAIGLVTNPIKTMIIAFGALIGYAGLASLAYEEVDTTLQGLSETERETVEGAREAADAYEDAIGRYNEAVAGIDKDMGGVKTAWETLQTLVNDNGEVAEGYESKVQGLLDIINEALGTEYTMQGNVIQGYAEMSGAIDNLIEKKKAEILLEANEEAYKAAVQNIDAAREREALARLQLRTDEEALAAAKAAQKEFLKEHQDLAEAQQYMRDSMAGLHGALDDETLAYKLAQETIDRYSESWGEVTKAISDAEKAIDNQNAEIAEAAAQTQKYYDDMSRYNDAYTEIIAGNYEKANEILTEHTKVQQKSLDESGYITDEMIAQTKREYDIRLQEWQDYKDAYERGEKGRNKEELARLKKQFDEISGIMNDMYADQSAQAYAIGQATGMGLAGGISATKANVSKAAANVMAGALNAMKTVALIASPSKRGRAIGKNVGESVGLGLDDSYDDVMDSAGNLADGIFDNIDSEPYVSVTSSDDGNGGIMSDVLGVLRDIRDSMGFDVVLNDGVIAGRIDKLLGQTAMRKVRGNA